MRREECGEHCDVGMDGSWTGCFALVGDTLIADGRDHSDPLVLLLLVGEVAIGR